MNKNQPTGSPNPPLNPTARWVPLPMPKLIGPPVYRPQPSQAAVLPKAAPGTPAQAGMMKGAIEQRQGNQARNARSFQELQSAMPQVLQRTSAANLRAAGPPSPGGLGTSAGQRLGLKPPPKIAQPGRTNAAMPQPGLRPPVTAGAIQRSQYSLFGGPDPRERLSLTGPFSLFSNPDPRFHLGLPSAPTPPPGPIGPPPIPTTPPPVPRGEYSLFGGPDPRERLGLMDPFSLFSNPDPRSRLGLPSAPPLPPVSTNPLPSTLEQDSAPPPPPVPTTPPPPRRTPVLPPLVVQVPSPLEQDKELLRQQIPSGTRDGVRNILNRAITSIGLADDRKFSMSGRYLRADIITAAGIWGGFGNVRGLQVLTKFWAPGGGVPKVKQRGMKWNDVQENAVFICRKQGYNETWIHICPEIR